MSDQESQAHTGGAGTATVAAPQPKRGGGAGAVVLSVVLSLLVSGAAVVSAPVWSPAVSRMVGLPDPLRSVQQETARVARGLAEAETKIGGLAGQLGTLTTTVESGAESADAIHAASLALAAGELRTALRRTGPFDIELATLRTVAGKDADIEALLAGLDSGAEVGIPSLRQLRSDFPQAAAAAVNTPNAEPAAKEATDWYAPVSSAWTQIRYLVRLETPPADSPYAIAQRARARLGDDDLAGAVQEMEALPTPRDPATAAWIAQASARVQADRAAAALSTLALSKVAAK